MEILVVEDESAIADFLERGLTREGFAVQAVADGIEGERLALDHAFDLIVLDRMLPGRDGLEVLAAIRRSKPSLPVIMLTAKTGVADRIAGLDQGATDYVTKPFSFEELAARVRAHLRQADSEAATASIARSGAASPRATATTLVRTNCRKASACGCPTDRSRTRRTG